MYLINNSLNACGIMGVSSSKSCCLKFDSPPISLPVWNNEQRKLAENCVFQRIYEAKRPPLTKRLDEGLPEKV